MQNRLTIPLKLGLNAQFRDCRLTKAQRTVASWAKVDDYDAILDLDCSEGNLLLYYLNRYNIRACGVAANPQEEQKANSLLSPKAEVLRADRNDLPWRNSSFDTVFLTRLLPNHEGSKQLFAEIKRVLKYGAQVVFAVSCNPLQTGVGRNFFKNKSSSYLDNPFILMEKLGESGFTDISMRSAGFRYSVVIANTMENRPEPFYDQSE
jgi:SAM-dependent methyltransferase